MRNAERVVTLGVCVILPVFAAAAQSTDVFARVVRDLTAVVQDPRSSDLDVEVALSALGALGGRAAPAGGAILDRVAVVYRNYEFVNERIIPGIPFASVNALSQIGPAVVPTLVQRLRTGDCLVRFVVVQALAEIGEPASEAIVPLRDLWLAEVDGDDPKCVLEPSLEAGAALARMGEEAIPTLIKEATNTRSNIRGAALDSLGEFRRQPGLVLPTLMRALGDENQYTRQHAIKSIGRLKVSSPDVIAALTEIAKNDPDEQTRTLAASTLRELQK